MHPDHEYMRRLMALVAAALLAPAGCQTDFGRISDLPLHDEEAINAAQMAAGREAERRTTRETVDSPAAGQSPGPGAAVDLPSMSLTLRDALLAAFQRSEVVRTVDGGGLSRIAATQYEPMIAEERLRAEQARFDPSVSAGYIGSRIEEPPDAFFGPGLPVNTRRDEGQFYASLSKPWATGATTSVGYLPPLAYLFFPNGVTGFNPQYSSAFVFDVRQPLLKGAGIDVNMAPIRIAQLAENQSELEVRQAMLAQVRSIEEAYWDLQGAMAILQAVESVLPLLEEAVRIEQLRFDAELVTKAELARVHLQQSQFLQQRVQAKTEVANRQFRLGNLLGLSRDDNLNFVPVDPPHRTPPHVDPEQAMQVALSARPDLMRQQMAVQVSDLRMMVAGNQARPQLDLQALYRTSGLADRLDDSLSDAASFQYPDVTVGATFTVPLGLRAARAAQRASELEYARNIAILRQSTENVRYQLAEIAREINRAWSEYSIASQRVQQSLDWLRVSSIRFASPPPGGAGPDWLVIQLNDYQQAVRAHVDAVSDASQSLARYNAQLARYEEAQGTLLDKRQVLLNELPAGPPPFPAAVPAQPPTPPPVPAPQLKGPSGPGNATYQSYRQAPVLQTSAVAATPGTGSISRTPPDTQPPSAAGASFPSGRRQFSLPPTPEP